MRFSASIFQGLLKPIDRRAFAAIVARHGGDAYDKTFDSWNHLVALIFAQLADVASLRGLIAAWNANAHCHYHLGAGGVARSTLADANARRPWPVFAETFELLMPLADRLLRREGAEMVRLIDSTPIPLPQMCAWALSNGRINGLKMHVLYDPNADQPRRVEITPANVNDIAFGKATPIEEGATYVFDKAYCAYDWWQKIHENQAFFVTRIKKNARFAVRKRRALRKRRGDGFTVLDDAVVALASRGDSMLDIPLRRVTVKRDSDGKTLELLSNDMQRSALDIGRLYKTRWEIELLFRWIKQHLKLRSFLGRSENAVRLQTLAAMVAFLLLRIAQRLNRVALTPLRFAELIGQSLFQRKPIARIDKPPEINPSKPRPKTSTDQMEFCYA
jgi:putative transposase